MQVAQKLEARTEQQPAQRQGNGNKLASPRGSEIAQLAALAANSPRMTAQGAAAAQLAASPAMAEQGQRMGTIKDSARMTIQQKRADGGGEAVQRVEDEETMQGKFQPAQLAEEEEPLQGKVDAAQLMEEEEPLQGKAEAAQLMEEEEPLQGKVEAAQLMEEEEPLQGKAEAAQLMEEEEPLQGKAEAAQLMEEEEPLQGKFETAQLAEEEEPLQGKFEPAQLAEEEDPLQGKFEPAQLAEDEEPLQGKAVGAAVAQREEAPSPNKSGLPNQLKSGIESMSGMSMDHVNVHYNSAEPAQLNAHAFAQGSDIHVAPGQEQHLPHEAWHVVQQAQGRVQATTQMKTGTPVNDDVGLETEADVMGAKAMDTGKQVEAQSQAQLKEAEAGSTTAQLTRGRSAAVTSREEPVEAPTESEQTALEEHTDEEGEVVTSDGVAISELADPEEKKSLAEKGAAIAGGVKQAGSVSAGVADTASSIEKAADPLLKGETLFASTNSAFDNIKDAVAGVAGKFISPVFDMITAGLGMKTKWAQWNVFQDEATEMKGGKRVKRADASPEAAYALTKSPAGFLKHVKDMFMAVVAFTRNLCMLIPGAQLGGAILAVFTNIVGLVDGLYKVGKSVYQSIFGEKKDTHSAGLLDKALGGNMKAVGLIFKLKLPSITGSGVAFLDQALALKNKASDKVVSKLTGKPIPERIIDLLQPGSGGPANAEELMAMLEVIKSNASSKAVLRDEIKATMTGYGK